LVLYGHREKLVANPIEYYDKANSIQINLFPIQIDSLVTSVYGTLPTLVAGLPRSCKSLVKRNFLPKVGKPSDNLCGSIPPVPVMYLIAAS